ncbi:MAG: sigma-70 family RNA polymerase sigma factor [Butyrivibrio sp.]|nr:sigma-70 family RNA polymerase sigma factor [Muribaculum sp.]MCM1553060.1 sigma-70 family RNA polymerase sigma factor [Butyrivibrio sp.]
MSAFEELYKRYYSQVYFYVLGLCRNEHIAEEITQDTFFKVLEKMDTFHGECKVNVWIIQIAKNTFYNYCRKKKIDPESSFEDIAAEGSIEEKIIDRESAEQIHVILHKMQEPYKEVFWMRTFGELSFKEIGSIHGKTESWARVTYHRAKLMIREEMR